MSSTVTSQDLVLYMNGQVYAQVTNFSWNSSTSQTPKYALDSLMPYEIMPGPALVTGSVSVVKTQNDGGLEGAGFTTQFSNLARQKYNTISIRQRSTGQSIFEAKYCSINGQNWNMPTKGILSGNFSFMGIMFTTDSAVGSTNG